MKVTKLPIGEHAPVDVDCLQIEEQAEATYRLAASALCADTDEGESVSLVGGPLYETLEAAEQAGMVWAANVGVTHLFISIGTLQRPLPLIEMDKPL